MVSIASGVATGSLHPLPVKWEQGLVFEPFAVSRCVSGEAEMPSPPRGRGPLSVIATALSLCARGRAAATYWDTEAQVRLQDHLVRDW